MGTLIPGIPVADLLPQNTVSFDDPSGARYWRLFAADNDIITLTGTRLDRQMDLGFIVLRGLFSDTAQLSPGFFSNPNALFFADDEIPHEGPFGDPLLTFRAQAGIYKWPPSK